MNIIPDDKTKGISNTLLAFKFLRANFLAIKNDIIAHLAST
ncbi:Uncharacterised protein [Chlamydia trachomatis]|nr:Uncharacterised protein [Chlamydia trachomatis]